jgi:DNA-binding IclR family transcriptional regulator
LNGLPNISRSALELIGSREITTQELAGALQITAANTNRFLNALQQNGFAQIVGEKSP